jgi:hypothetical protein
LARKIVVEGGETWFDVPCRPSALTVSRDAESSERSAATRADDQWQAIEEKPMKPTTTRRRFMTAALAGTAGALCPAPAAAQDNPPRPAADQARAMAEIVRMRLGQHLNEEQMRSVQQRLARNVATSAQLQRTRLNNGDEPAFAFVPME